MALNVITIHFNSASIFVNTISLRCPNLPHFELIRMITQTHPIQDRMSKFGPQIHLSTIQDLMNFGLDCHRPSISFLVFKPIFLTNWLIFSLLCCQSQILVPSLSTRVNIKTIFDLLQHSPSFVEGGEHSPLVYHYLVLNTALGNWGYFIIYHHSC